jgi:hypothetical protein
LRICGVQRSISPVLGLSLSEGSPSCAKTDEHNKAVQDHTLVNTDNRKILRMKEDRAARERCL